MNAELCPNVQPSPVRRVLISLGLSFVLACGIISTAQAEDVYLNSSNVRATTTEDLRLIRTSMTPSKVELSLPIAMETTVCAEYGTRLMSGRSGAHCGYDRVVRRVCVPTTNCRNDPRTGRTICSAGRRCYDEVYNVERYCSWEETYCKRYEVEVSNRTRNVMIKFKNMVSLNTGEQELFSLIARQNHSDGQDATFSVTPISTIRPVKITERDGPLTGFKDVITIKGE